MSVAPHLFCSLCGVRNQAQAQFCVACGQPLRPVKLPQVSSGARNSSADEASRVPSPPIQRDDMPAQVVAAPPPIDTPRVDTPRLDTASRPRVGVLKERYRLLGLVGRGGFGKVYKAEDTGFDNRTVAVKEMSPKKLSSEEVEQATAAFQQEARMLAKLQHPNLPAIFDYFTEGSRWYLVMSFIEGQSLFAHLQTMPGKQMPVEDVLHAAIVLCGVLDYLHNRQPPIIFRDLKPSNIMRTPDGELYLIDFGLARNFKPGQPTDTVALGSPGYAAPEQYGKSQSSPRTDIYNLGATLHHLLSGADPSQALFFFAPLTLATYPELGGLVARMVDRKIERRPLSMMELKRELQRIQAAGPTPVARPVRGAVITPHLNITPAEVQNILAQQQQKPGQRQTPPAPPQPPDPRRRAAQPPAQPAPHALQPPALYQSAPHPAVRPPYSPPGQGASQQPVRQPDDEKARRKAYEEQMRQSAQHPVVLPPPVAPAAPGPVNSGASWPPVAPPGPVGSVASWPPAAGKPQAGPISHYGNMQAGRIAAPPGAPPLGPQRNGMISRRAMLYGAIGVTGLATLGLGGVLVTRLMSLAHPAPAQSAPPAAISSSPGGGGPQSTGTAPGALTTLAPGLPGSALTSIDWSPDGKRVAAAFSDGHVEIRDPDNRAFLLSPKTMHGGTISMLQWSDDGRQIATASADKTVKVWDANSGNVTQLFSGHKASVLSLSWSPEPDVPMMVSCDSSGVAMVWGANNGQLRKSFTGHKGAINSVSWGPSNLIATGGDDHKVQLWEALSGATIHTYGRHTSPVHVVAWAPSGVRIASASDTLVRVWGADPTIQEITTFTGHTDVVTDLAWSPNLSVIVSVGADKMAQIWKAGTGDVVRSAPADTQIVNCVTWSPDGTRVAYGDAQGNLIIWRM